MVSLYKEFGKIMFACLTKTCLFVIIKKSDLPIDKYLTAAVY